MRTNKKYLVKDNNCLCVIRSMNECGSDWLWNNVQNKLFHTTRVKAIAINCKYMHYAP